MVNSGQGQIALAGAAEFMAPSEWCSKSFRNMTGGNRVSDFLSHLQVSYYIFHIQHIYIYVCVYVINT